MAKNKYLRIACAVGAAAAACGAAAAYYVNKKREDEFDDDFEDFTEACSESFKDWEEDDAAEIPVEADASLSEEDLANEEETAEEAAGTIAEVEEAEEVPAEEVEEAPAEEAEEAPAEEAEEAPAEEAEEAPAEEAEEAPAEKIEE